jgi:hypothetical protein
VLLALGACARGPEAPVCGLHSASAPVFLVGKDDAALAVGARLMPSDRVRATGFALLECFGGALRVLDDETVRVGDLKEARIEATTLPRKVLKGRELVPGPTLSPPMLARYSDNRFTPKSALQSGEPSTGAYLRAFFTPNGIENLGAAPREEGPASLPPPTQRGPITRVRAGPLGEGGPTLQVEDDVVFAETDDLITAALAEGKTYALGRAVRLVLPKGTEATLRRGDFTLALEGPMDLRLR